MLVLTKTIDIIVPNIDELVTKMAKWALEAGKSVVYFGCSQADIPIGLFDLLSIYPNKINFMTSNKNVHKIEYENKRYEESSIPVIFVGGLIAEADTFEVLLSIAARLRKDKMCPMVLCRHPIGRIFGFNCVSHVFNDTTLKESEKILALNKLVQELESIETPGIIVMEAPGAVMKFNNDVTNGFGIHSVMMCHALPPDHFICCIPYELAVGEYIDVISKNFERTLSTSITAVHASNMIFDYGEMRLIQKISYVHTNLFVVQEHVKKHNKNSKFPIVNISAEGVDKLYTALMNETGEAANEVNT